MTHQITLGNIYKPPKDDNNNANIESFINERAPILSQLGNEKSAKVIVGDFNIDLLKIKGA